MSINIGVAPTNEITSVVAKYEKLVVKTASPLPMFFAIRGISKASVPLAQVTQCLTPT